MAGFLEEVFALWTLYHVVSWGIFSWERSPDAGALRRLVVVHALPAAACLALLAAPLGWHHPLRVAVFAPAAYLFWSSLHVLQTLAVRGGEGRSGSDGHRSSPIRTRSLAWCASKTTRAGRPSPTTGRAT